MTAPLASLRALMAKASPLPWSPPHLSSHDAGECRCGYIFAWEQEKCVATVHTAREDHNEQYPPNEQAEANGSLIAEAVNALPSLLADAETLRTAGVCEIGAVNPSVASYCREWEARAEKAEAEVARLLALPAPGATGLPVEPLSLSRQDEAFLDARERNRAAVPANPTMLPASVLRAPGATGGEDDGCEPCGWPRVAHNGPGDGVCPDGIKWPWPAVGRPYSIKPDATGSEALWWRNPFSGEDEALARFSWPTHPKEWGVDEWWDRLVAVLLAALNDPVEPKGDDATGEADDDTPPRHNPRSIFRSLGMDAKKTGGAS